MKAKGERRNITGRKNMSTCEIFLERWKPAWLGNGKGLEQEDSV
jgi:hypothetical protein